MTKFAFIYPGNNIDFSTTAPINIALLAAILEKAGIETIIIDEIAGQDIEQRLLEFKPDMVGITAVTSQFPDALIAGEIARRLGFKTVIGGRHVLIKPEEAEPYFDIIIQGEGEDVIADVALGKLKDKIIKAKPIEKLDDYPMPAYHLLDMDFYANSRKRITYSFLNFAPAEHKIGSLLTSRGCPYSCIFCHNSWKGLKFRCLSSQRVLEEVKILMNNYGIQSIFFIDDDFFFNKKRLMEICDLFIKNKIDLVWGCNSRVTDITEEALIKAKQAGCKQVTFGFESGSQRILEVLNKKATIEKAHEAVLLCNKVGMQVSGTFIVGTPTETVEDVQMTKDFIVSHDIDSIGITKMTPFPGTAIWEWCEQKGFIPETFSWSDFNYSNVPIRTNENFSSDDIDYYCRELNKIVLKKYNQKLGRYEEEKESSLLVNFIKFPRKTINKLIRGHKKMLLK